MKFLGYICLLFLAPASFGHYCDQLSGVPQYKHQEYNRNHIKYVTKFSKILYMTKAAQNLFKLSFEWGKIL